MFLLNLCLPLVVTLLLNYLHPIMFLLNLKSPKSTFKSKPFTSHYVPIKSSASCDILSNCSYLHPIMFLLNLCLPLVAALVTSFTSHYVPIKSNIHLNSCIYYLHLHPIMFLLNLMPETN